MTCRPIAGGYVCGPTQTRTLEVRDVGFKWCFQCRKRVLFTDTWQAEAGPSYYEPWCTRQCPRGHTDGDLGFGRSRWL